MSTVAAPAAVLPSAGAPDGRRTFHALVVVSGIGFGLTAPFTALLVVALGASPEWAAYVVASMGLSLLVVDFFGTRFVPRLDSRLALTTSMVVFGVGSLLSAVTTAWVVVGLARVLQGFGGALFMGGGVQAAVRLVRDHQRGGAIGTFNAAWFAGIATGPLGGGLIVALRPGADGLRLLFGVCAAVNLLGALAAWVAAPRLAPTGPPRLGLPRGLGLRGARVWVALVLAAIGQAVRSGLAMTVVPLLGEQLGMAWIPLGVALFALAFSDIVVMHFGARFTDRRGRFVPLALTLAWGVLATLALALVGGFAGFTLGALAVGVTVGATWVMPAAMTVDLATDPEAGLAAYRIASDVGMLGGGVLAGVGIALGGLHGALYGCAGLLAVALALLLAVGETRPASPPPIGSTHPGGHHAPARHRRVRRDRGGPGHHAQPAADGPGARDAYPLPVRPGTAARHPAAVHRTRDRAGDRHRLDRRRGPVVTGTLGRAATVTDLADLTATELLGLFASGDATPTQAVEACLARIEATDDTHNAVLLLLADRAREQAAASDDLWAAGTARPLEGVPYGLKDIVATAGITTTGGSSLFTDHVPTQDAALAARLADAGGVLLAKLGTFEFACGGAVNRTFGPTRNPWNPARTTGGSSSGSGAAVALGQMPLAIGTDTGGSIRIPASFCGLTGIKPTYGRVPRHGVMGLSWTLDHAGPMTRSVADAALMLDVIAGPDPRDPTTLPAEDAPFVAALGRDVTGMRVARPRGSLEDEMHPAVAAAHDAAVAELAAAGVEIVDVELPSVDLAAVAAWWIIYAEMLSLHEAHADRIEDRDEMGASLLGAAPFVSAADYLRALRLRPLFQGELQAAMQGCDALVTPAMTSLPPLIAPAMTSDLGDREVPWLDAACRTTVPFNLTGSPALVLPSGLVDGMPVSMQLVGHPRDEASLFALGAAYQTTTDHHLRRPPVLA